MAKTTTRGRVSSRQPAPRSSRQPAPRSSRQPASRNTRLAATTQAGRERFAIWFNRVFKSQSIYFYRLLGVTLFLVAFGLVMVLSASSIDSLKASNNSFAVFNRQLAAAALGLVAMAAVSILPSSLFRKYARVALFATLTLQAFVALFGTSINGNRNWINLGFVNIQPSEFLKVALVLFMASYLTARQLDLDIPKVWWKGLAPAGIAILAVMAGSDLGTSIIMLIMAMGLMIVAGLPNRITFSIVAVLAVASPILINFGSSSRAGRILAWLNPNAPDPNGYNWQSEHGMWAVAAGGIFGQGLGSSKMKWSWIPEVENDFIFAIIAEEFGLIGALVVIGLFVFLAISFLKIWQRTQDTFSRHVVSGIMIWIIFQALVNIAVVLRLAPVLGVPLPLISAGGSSLLATLGAIGIVLAIERENHAQPYAARARTRR
jgi:hypothetical protein